MFRLSDYVNLLVEGNFNGLSDKYNSKYGNNIDKYVNALIGLRINLGKTYKEDKHEVYRVRPTRRTSTRFIVTSSSTTLSISM